MINKSYGKMEYKISCNSRYWHTKCLVLNHNHTCPYPDNKPLKGITRSPSTSRTWWICFQSILTAAVHLILKGIHKTKEEYKKQQGTEIVIAKQMTFIYRWLLKFFWHSCLHSGNSPQAAPVHSGKNIQTLMNNTLVGWLLHIFRTCVNVYLGLHFLVDLVFTWLPKAFWLACSSHTQCYCPKPMSPPPSSWNHLLLEMQLQHSVSASSVS